jgi:hypothetical protein
MMRRLLSRESGVTRGDRRRLQDAYRRFDPISPVSAGSSAREAEDGLADRGASMRPRSFTLSPARLASALATAALIAVPAGVARAAAVHAPFVPAAPAATSCGTYGTMNAYVWASDVRVHTGPHLWNTVIGECGPSWVHADCQLQGDEVVYGAYRNNWWVFAETHVGNFYNGYISGVFIPGGSNDSPLPGIPLCSS